MSYGIIVYGGASTFQDGSNTVFKSSETYSRNTNITPGAFIDSTQASFLPIGDLYLSSASSPTVLPRGEGRIMQNMSEHFSNYANFIPTSNKRFAYISKYEVNEFIRETIKRYGNCRSTMSFKDLPETVKGIHTEVLLDSGRMKIVSYKGDSIYAFTTNTNPNLLKPNQMTDLSVVSKTKIAAADNNFGFSLLLSYFGMYQGSLYFSTYEEPFKVNRLDKSLNDVQIKLREITNRNTQNLKDSNEFILIPIEAYKHKSLEIPLLCHVFGEPHIWDIKLPVTITYRG